MRRETTFKLHSDTTVTDLDLIRQVAGNPDLASSQVFEFPEFIIAKSGRNSNDTDITPEGQKAAVDRWIGKSIYYNGHSTEPENQIGRITKTWITEEDGITITKGIGYGIHSDVDDAKFAKIKNRIHQEMSCGYDLDKALCSACKSDVDLESATCGNGHKMGEGDAYWMDIEFRPDHVAFVGRPAIEGAGLIAAEEHQATIKTFEDENQQLKDAIASMARDAVDGREFRIWAADEFSKYLRRNHSNMQDDEIEGMVSRMTAKDMLRLGKLEKSKFVERIMSGKQQLQNTEADEYRPTDVKFFDTKSFFKHKRGK